jgi:hypothetical protein
LKITKQKLSEERGTYTITGMIEMCYRKEISSQDRDIIPVKLRDIFAILDQNQTIDTLILTTRSGILSAEGLLKTLFLIHKEKLVLQKIYNDVLIGEFNRERSIKVLVPYSTSRSYHQDDPKKYQQVEKMYAYCFDKHAF